MTTTSKSERSHCRPVTLSAYIVVWAMTFAFLPASIFALGFRIPNQDAEATARGNAFVATADNPSAIYYNPAGITQLEGTHAQVGAHLISVNSHFEAAVGGGEEDTKFEIQMVPQVYIVHAPKDCDFAFGLGIYVPFGLGLNWPEKTPFRNEAVEGRLQYTTISPVVAWKITPTLSIAAGPTINFGQVFLRKGIGLVPGDEFRFRGSGFAFGAKAGLLWQPHQKWSFGVNYFSPTTVDFDGHSSAKPVFAGKQSTSAKVDFPQFIVGGVSFRPTANWNIEVDVDWTDWNSLNTVTFKNTAFGDVGLPLNWKSSFLCHLGATRQLRDGYWVAAGYFYSQNSTSDKDFTPLVPDTDLHVASIGIGHKGKRWSWALSGQIITGPSREISNGKPSDGTYQFFNQAINFAVDYRF